MYVGKPYRLSVATPGPPGSRCFFTDGQATSLHAGGALGCELKGLSRNPWLRTSGEKTSLDEVDPKETGRGPARPSAW